MSLKDKQQRPFKPSARMEEPDAALASYLGALLSEIDDLDDGCILPKTKVGNPTADIREQQPRKPAQKLSIASRKVTSVEAIANKGSRQAEQIVPEWAKTTFQVLLFKVSGLTLGVPLTALVGIMEWKERANVLPGQPAWHLGLFVCREQKIIVVDTAQLVMPERLDCQTLAKRQSGGYLLLIENGFYGLAVDALASTVMMEQKQVRWRTGLGKRPWLAGTMIERLSILLDVDGLIGIIAA